MPTIPELYPNPEDFLALDITDVAPVILRLARDRLQNGIVHVMAVTHVPVTVTNYPPVMMPRVNAHVSAAWDWLRTNGLIAPDAGYNGTNGYMVITAKGEEAAATQDFSRLKSAMAFPKELLHPSIREKVWKELVRNDFPDAVFYAFRTVEEAVRAKGGYKATDVGVDLVRMAFNPTNGPLTDMSHPIAEREALSHLFAGAIGSYKNPHSHRTVTLSDLREAQEQCMLASHLLSIVDARSR